jgi:hypothetical protein
MVIIFFASLDFKPRCLAFGKKRESHLKWADAHNPRAIIPPPAEGMSTLRQVGFTQQEINL